MRLQVLVVGIIILVIGGGLEAVGFSEFFSCSSNFFSTCNIGQPTAIAVLGGVLFSVGMIVTIIGAILGVAPSLRGLRTPEFSNPTVKEKETVVTEVLIQCRSCGSRYPQGTMKCLTCGANL